MQANRIALLGLLLNSLVPGWTLCAGELAANVATNKPAFKVAVVNEFGPHIVPTRRVYLTSGTNRFAFLISDGLRMQPSDPQKITLVGSDNSCLITVRIMGPMPVDAKELAVDDQRERALELHPGARIMNEFSMHAGNAGGPAFDLRWTAAGDFGRMARVAFIPSAAGILEFSLESSAEKFPQMQPTLNFIMLTFRASENGKLEVIPISDQI